MNQLGASVPSYLRAKCRLSTATRSQLWNRRDSDTHSAIRPPLIWRVDDRKTVVFPSMRARDKHNPLLVPV